MTIKPSLTEIPEAVVSEIYDCLRSGGSWDVPLDALRVELSSVSASLRVSVGRNSHSEFLVSTGPIVSEKETFDHEQMSSDDLLPIRLKVGEARVLRRIDHASSKAFYDGLARNGVDCTMAMLIGSHGEAEYIMQVNRGKGADIYSSRDCALFELIGKHLFRALAIRRQIRQAEVVNDFQSDTLDRLGIAAVLVDCGRHSTALNKTARSMLEMGQGLRHRNGRLLAVDDWDDKLFQAMLKDVLASTDDGRCRAMLIKSSEDSRDLNLLISGRRTVSVITGKIEICALVFMRRSSIADHVDTKVMQELFSFTKAEAKLALGLAKGQNLAAVESELNIRHNTARAHLRSMFLKVDVSRQSELVHLLTNSLAPLSRNSELA